MATLTSAEYKALAARAYAALKHYPNVHSVGIGGRETQGRPTGEIVIKVFVSKKHARTTLTAGQIVPAQFEGVKTDVVEASEPSLDNVLDRIPGFRFDERFDEDEEKYRPLKGGSQIQGENGGSGTLGFFARVAGDSRIMAVTNHHVLFDIQHPPKPNLRVGNPHSGQSCTRCCVGAFGKFVAAHYDPSVDVAISVVDPSTNWLAEIQCIGYVRGFHDLTPPETLNHDYGVRKYGRTTRLTGGTVQALHVNGTSGGKNVATRAYANAIAIKPNPLPGGAKVRFSAPGDSGSAYVNDANEIVGLHFAGQPDQTQADAGWSWGIPIADIVASFKNTDNIELRPATATALGAVQTTPAAAGDTAAPPIDGEAAAVATRLEADLAVSPRGRQMTDLWLRHSVELNHLVNHNRKVATLWHRNAGPALFQHAVSVATRRDVTIPEAIGSRPVDELVDRIVDVFARYGSEPLKTDISQHRTVLPGFAGRSYEDLLREIRGPGES